MPAGSVALCQPPASPSGHHVECAVTQSPDSVTLQRHRGRVTVSQAAEDFTEFVAARATALLRTAYLLTGGDRQAAEDLLQEALVETYVRWRRIKDPQAREAYVRRILIRQASRGWRAARSREVSTPDVPDAAIPPPSDSVDQELDLCALLRRLSPKQRAVMVLRYYDDLSEFQVAAILGCSPGTVKSHSARGLRMLRQLLHGTGYVAANRRSHQRDE